MRALIKLLILFAVLAHFEFAHANPDAIPFKKIMVVYFENHDSKDVLKQPGFVKFASLGTLLTNFSAITHPSQPNYIAAIAGSTMGVTDNENIDLDGKHIGDLLEAHGKTWKVYAEGFMGNCDPTASVGAYVRSHVPFLSFLNITQNPERCRQHVVPATQFAIDLENNQLPSYSMYIPDKNNNGHDKGIAFANRYFVRTFMPLMKDPNFTNEMLFVVTFDEGYSDGDNRIYTALVGPGIKPGGRSASPYDHYSLLRTIEDVFGLGNLGRNDAKAQPIREVLR